VEQTDFVLKDRDVMVRRYVIENIGPNEVDLGFVQYSSTVSTTPELRSTLFDFNVMLLFITGIITIFQFHQTVKLYSFNWGITLLTVQGTRSFTDMTP